MMNAAENNSNMKLKDKLKKKYDKASFKLIKKQRYFYLTIFYKFFYTLFSIIPRSWALVLVVFSQPISMRFSIHLLKIFMRINARKIRKMSHFPMPLWIIKVAPFIVINIFMHLRFYKDAKRVIDIRCNKIDFDRVNYLVKSIYFEMGEFKLAQDAISNLALIDYNDVYIIREKLYLDIIQCDETLARAIIKDLADLLPSGWCPHSNIAARYLGNYKKTLCDERSGVEGLLSDMYNYVGQRVTHVGMGELSTKLYSHALNLQDQLKKSSFKLSEELVRWLAEKQIIDNDFKILSWEWVTQIGHIGMLDMLLRMKKLNWWTGKALLLLPKQKIIPNKVFLSLFSEEVTLVIHQINIPDALYDELFSLQRYVGIGFNAWKFPDGEVVPWQQAGARLLVKWEENHYKSPVRHYFEKQYANNTLLYNQMKRMKESWGMSPDDWFVCLHIRDLEYYDEIEGSGQTHRNANITSYKKAVDFITKKGGFVIKMGGKTGNTGHLKIINYPLSFFKSEMMDLLLIRHARFFIGTTSGLTNLAVSFDIPCALVNCITTDSQLWNSKVRFVPKMILNTSGHYITQLELTSAPWRWRCFAYEILLRYDAKLLDNTADEILETVKEVYHFSQDSLSEYMKGYSNADSLLTQWKSCLSVPEYYGAALPSIYFLNKYEKAFLENAQPTHFMLSSLDEPVCVVES